MAESDHHGDATGVSSTRLLQVEQEQLLLRLLSLASALPAAPPTTTELFPLLNLTKLDLPNCRLSELPDALPDALPNLSVLFLSNNRFSTMPAVVGRCRKLQMVAFKSNGMTRIDSEALQSQLRWLILTDNRLAELPSTIGRCAKLQKLILSGNQLECLPAEISGCRSLELVRLASNCLKESPAPVLRSLPNLSWVGLSDNPFLSSNPRSVETSRAEESSSGEVSSPQSSLLVWEDVPDNYGEVLGRGAAGVVRKVRFRDDQYVAVKTFSAAMTSDGLAQHERKIACLLSNAMPASSSASSALVRVLGETRSGSLVLEYLDGYAALASPPSLESCSRDVYDKSLYLSGDQAVTVVSTLLSTLFELHRIGVCHGDFYAHNILMNSSDPSQVRLTDWGAAFQYDPHDKGYSGSLGTWIQTVELRAFAVFLQELLDHALLPPLGSHDDDDEPKGGGGTTDEEPHLENAGCSARQLLTDLREVCLEAVDNERGFESPVIWWKQRRLQSLATALDEELDL
jgi:hypothetical protein